MNPYQAKFFSAIERLGLLLAAGAIFALVWTSQQAKGAFAQSPAIRAGASVSLSGKYAGPSLMLQNAYHLWADQVNHNGGLLGRRLKLIFYDDKSQPERCARLYAKLVRKERVDLVLAPYGTPLTYRASEVTEKNGYVLAACAASGPAIWNREYKLVFGIYSTADRYFIGYLDILARRGFKTVGIIFEDSAFAKAAAEGSRTWAERFGLQVVFYGKFNGFLPDLERLTAEALEVQPDGMIFCLYPPDTYAICKFMSSQNRRFNSMAFTIAPVFDDFYAKVGPLAEGVCGPSQWEPDPRLPFPGSRQFIADFKRYTGTMPTYHAASAYASCQILTHAIQQTGSLDQQNIAAYIRSRDTMTITGRFRVDHRGRQVGHNPLLIQWQKGRKQIVYPTRLRTAEAIFPTPKGTATP